MALTPRQIRFVDEYLIDLNATQAAIRAGYSPKTAGQQGERLLKNVEIQALLTERMKDREQRTEITQDRVLQEIARVSFYDPRKLLSDDGTPLPISELDDDTAAAIAGVKVKTFKSEEGDVSVVTEYRLPDKGANLDRLMKHLGLYERDNNQRNSLLCELPREAVQAIRDQLKKMAGGK